MDAPVDLEALARVAAYLDAVRSFARALVTARHVLVGLSCAKVGEHWSGPNDPLWARIGEASDPEILASASEPR
jgi:hypothetical protein